MDGFTPRKQMAQGDSMPNIPSTRGNKDNSFSQSSGPTFGVDSTLGGVASVHIWIVMLVLLHICLII